MLILLLSAAALWFALCEAPVLFGLYEPAYALRRSLFAVLISTMALISASAVSGDAVAFRMAGYFSLHEMAPLTLFMVTLSSFLSLLLLKMLSVRGSAVYAIAGALSACSLKTSGIAFDFSYFISFIAAPALAFVMASLTSLAMRTAVRRRKIHLITLSRYMRIAVILVIMTCAVAVGVNFGGFIRGISSIVQVQALPSAAFLLTSLLLFLTFYFKNTESDGYYNDFTISNVIAVGLATAVTMLFFSFEASASSVGLSPVPLSVSSLVVASLAGVSMVQRTHLVGKEVYIKEASSFVLTPLIAFAITFILMYFSGNGEDMVDFIVMALALVALLAVCFWSYARVQKRNREMTDRLVASQQQQIYENSRALNDMEIKVVMSENQALHNSIEMKRQEVMNVALSIVEQKEYLEHLNSMVKKLSKSQDDQERDRIISEMASSLSQRLSYERDVDSQYFYAQAESLHEDFNAKLSENHPGLTQQERRLATLLRLGFSSKYIATLMNITPKSVEISRYRLRQKLGLSKGDNLVNYIQSL